jgi:hypothetical protein
MGGTVHGVVVPAEFAQAAPGSLFLGYDLMVATTRTREQPPLLAVRMPWGV